MRCVLACDLGGTHFRAALVDDGGVMLAESVAGAPRGREEGGAAEIEPEAWWILLLAAASSLARQAPEAFGAAEGVAICGVTRTQVFLGHDDRPSRPAMTWKDNRAGATALRLREAAEDAHPERGHLNAFHPLARLAWLREAEPAVFGALACILEPKDYLNLRLTGQRAGDPVSFARLIAAGAGEGADLLALAGIPRRLLPRLREPLDVVGAVSAGLPAPLDRLAGRPVFCCANDTYAAVVGLGAMRAGHAYNISGTTEVLGVVGTEPVAAEGLIGVDWRGLFQLGGPSQNGADTIAWLMQLLGRDARAVGPGLEALLARPRQPQPLLFLPYLQGERVPYWDPTLRGALIGLGRQHGAGDCAWAVMEGVAFQNRLVLERAEAARGGPVGEIRFGGGAAVNPRWCQIKADVTGRPVVTCAAPEPGLLGAAIMAWTGLGRFTSLAQAQERLVAVSVRHEPDPARARHYDRLFALYRRGEAALAPISRDLVALGRETLGGAVAAIRERA